MARLVVAGGVVGVPEADAVRIEHGRIVAVGVAAELGAPADVTDRFPGAVIAPGLRDAHFHPVGYTAALQRLVVKDAADFDALAGLLAGVDRELTPGATLIGIRLDDETLAERRLPTRVELDAMVADRPVILYRYCGHIAAVNTAALEAAAVGPDTPDPDGGVLDRGEDGRPTGVLRETAINLVADVIGDRAVGLDPESVTRASRFMASAGLTAVGAMVTPGPSLWCDTSPELDVFLSAAPELAVAMHTLLATTDPDVLEAEAARLQAAGPRVRFLGVKMFSDGSLGGHTAAMDEPFSDRPDQLGTTRLRMEEAMAAGRRSLALGGMVAIHAIGDRACGFVLDVFERLLDEGASPTDLRLEHASVLREADIARIADLGVIASVQPAFLASEAGWLEKRLGAERLSRTYAFGSLAAAGARLAGGSDCPVEPPHPLHGVASAIDRGGLTPEEALSTRAAFDLFTSGAAAALREPVPMQAGSPADLVVLDGDPLTASSDQIRRIEVVATYIDGALGSDRPYGPDWNG
jgi:predicted amidohydrolase YtcJ